MTPFQLLNRLHVHGGVVANGRVRTAAGLDADNAVRLKRLITLQEFGVLLGVDVVGDHGEIVARPQFLAQTEDQCRLAGTDGSANSDAHRT